MSLDAHSDAGTEQLAENEFQVEGFSWGDGTASGRPDRIQGIVVGRLVALHPTHGPHVDFTGCQDGPRTARTLTPLSDTDVGRQVAIMFEEGDVQRPLVMGLIQDLSRWNPENAVPPVPLSAELDQNRIELKANQEIVLRCGKASITLTKAGKILIRGAYLLSRSSGANRIKGGSVQIN